MIKVQKRLSVPRVFSLQACRARWPSSNLTIIVVKTPVIKTAMAIDAHQLILLSAQLDFSANFVITKKKKKNVINFFFIKLLVLMHETAVPVYNKLKIYGVGFSMAICQGRISFNIGATIAVSLYIHEMLIIRIMGRKSTILYVGGTNIVFVNNYCARCVDLRAPNTYTGKGIFYYKRKFVKKIGKLQQK